ncbi:MAG: FGGY family carbohydrate kinase [Clostridia bacterium]|nr:FGGY family carbohydrate kinase [Clostridia bacterium]
MNYTIGFDIGSTNVKGVLLSENAEIIEKSSVKFEYDYPKENYVEIGADKFIESCLKVLSELKAALPEGGKITGISEASASGNLLLLDSDFKPITPIYNWQDMRVTDEVSKVLGEDFDFQKYYESTGWQLGTQFALAELCYIKYHNPELLEKASMVCMSTEYLNYVLTGKFAIAPSAGTPFFLIDQRTRTYNKEVLDKLGITKDMLPPIMKTGELLGDVLPAFGLGDAKVYLGTFDHPSGAMSTGVTEEGTMLLSCGTSWVAFMPIMDRSVIIENNFLCDPFLSENGGPWGAMCSIPSISSSIDKYIEKFISSESDRFIKLADYAKESENGSGGLILSSDKEPDISGYTKGNIACAIMEMPARLLKEQLKVFMAKGIKFKKVYMAGGPTKSDIWVKITEQVLGMSASISNAEFSGAVGSAMLARK